MEETRTGGRIERLQIKWEKKKDHIVDWLSV